MFIFSFLYYYSTVSTSEAAYIIGGYYWVQDTSEVIVEFKDNNWRQIGKLATGRSGHGSIILNGETMVIGGDPTKNTDAETEIWNFTNGDHKVVPPTLRKGRYDQGIGLYIVPFDFCST